MNAPPVLALDQVSFGYGGEWAVEEVGLSVWPGNFVGLIGPNGSGKSTLMRLAVGLLRPARGEIRLFGQPIPHFRDWPRIGYVPQRSSARAGFPATVNEIILTGRTGRRGLWRRFTATDRQLAREALVAVGLAELGSRQIGELSGGQHQRVLLARALAGEPDLLLLDEPAAGVDAAAKLEVLDLLARLCRERHLAVVYVSHDLETLRPFLTQVALLHRRLIYFGTRDALAEREDVRRELVEAALASDHHEHRTA